MKPVLQASTATMTTSSSVSTSSPILLAINHKNLAFDGTIADMCHSKGCCTARGNRSDAALLVGLVQTCQGSEHIQIESMQLLLRHIVGSNQNDTKKEPFRRVAALLITFSIPSLDKAESESHNKHENMSMPLPPSVQLLFSLSRSDWDHLDHDINMRLRVPIPLDDPSSYYLLDDGTLIQERVSLFPPKNFSIHDLYICIQGTSNQIWKPPQTSTKIYCLMNALPEDVLVNHLAPVLQAKSLDCLRLLCTDLHTVLRAIVPGLKLRLFQHQIKSLDFMRL